MRKRLFTLCFALMAVTLGAMAAEELYVAGNKVTLSGTGTVTVSGGDIMGGTVKYDRDTKTLTLSGATIARTGNNNRGIRSSVSGLTIVFSGKNFISTTSAAALRFEANTTIKGSGTVTVKSDETALYVYKNTTVTISGVDRNRLTLNLDGKYGIQGEDGSSSEKVSIQRYVTFTASGTDNAIKLLNDLTVSGDANVTLKGNDSNSTINNLTSLTLTEGIAIDLPLCGQFIFSKKTIIKRGSNTGYKGDITIKQAIAINATYFPDANFRNCVNVTSIDQNYDGYLSNVEIKDVTKLDVSDQGISDLTGIGYFTSLWELDCSSNSLESLDVSKNTELTKLDCSDNNLTSLDVTKNTELTFLSCYSNSLKSLDVSKSPLKDLRCYGNNICGAAMTTLVNGLKSMYYGIEGLFYVCNDKAKYDNFITTAQVNIAKEKGWSVKKLNNYGKVEYYAGEEAIAIDAMNFPDDNFRKIVAAKDIDTDEDGILSAEEMEAVWMLDVENKGIADLTGVGNFPNLIALLCSGNTLTNLDISKNTKLVGLDCSNNRLTALNLSNNTVLSEVLCYGNDIKGEAMTYLVNSLPQMDDGSLCVIEEGASSDNVITKGQVVIAKKKGWNVLKINGSNVMDYESIAIDASNFPDPKFRAYLLAQDYGKDAVLTEEEMLAVTKLDLVNRGIKDLKGIEHFTALTELDCYYNSLKSLDISNNKVLTSLSCGDNSLTSLDVSKNTALTELWCFNNSLSSLDVSKNTLLTGLYCSSNSLESLDVSNNTALTYLDCGENSLKSLDVSNNTALTKLVCYGNNIKGTSMDNLVKSLPKVEDGLFDVVAESQFPDNSITAAQVKVATDKGWKVYKDYGNGYEAYAGLGDVNNDNKINQDDLDLLVQIVMGQQSAYVDVLSGDLNNDGKVDAADIVVMVNILNGK